MINKSIINVQGDQIFFQDKPLYFFVEGKKQEYLPASKVEITRTNGNNGYEFLIQEPGRIGIMFCTEKAKSLIGDMTTYVNTNVTSFYYCPLDCSAESMKKPIMEELDATTINRPVVHVISDVACSFSVNAEAWICCFKNNYEQHSNIITASIQDKTTFFLDVNYNYSTNLQRYCVERESIFLHRLSHTQDMKDALYYGMSCRNSPTSAKNLLSVAREIQEILNKNNVDSLIIGSMAGRLGGIQQDVNDIDILLADQSQLVTAMILLEQSCDRIEHNDFRVRMKCRDMLIEIGYDRYGIVDPPFYTRESNGLKYCDLRGLAWIALLVSCRMEGQSHVCTYQRKAVTQVDRYMKGLKIAGDVSITPDLDKVPDYYSHCVELCKRIQDLPMYYKDIRINEPFMVHGYEEEDILHVSIISNGSKNDARIVIPGHADVATWRDISGRQETCIIEVHDSFSLIFVPSIDLPGILSCQMVSS